MTSAGPATGESPTERTGVNRLEPWLESHPAVLAGFWAVLTAALAVNAVLRDRDGPLWLALSVALALGWLFLFVRQVRQARARRS